MLEPTDEQIIRTLAEEVMGWERSHHATPDSSWGGNWNPLTSIADAFMVVEKIGGLDLIKVDSGWMVGDGSEGFSTDGGFVEMQLENHAIAETAPRAISLAAYRVVNSQRTDAS